MLPTSEERDVTSLKYPSESETLCTDQLFRDARPEPDRAGQFRALHQRFAAIGATMFSG